VKGITIKLFDPNGAEYVLYDKDGTGPTWATSYPTPTATKSGDLTTWVGKNPMGKWRLNVIDMNFDNIPTDGKINGWSISIQTLSTKKVQVKGDLIVDGALTGTGGLKINGDLTLSGLMRFMVADSAPQPCSDANFGAAYASKKDKALYVCNGTYYFPLWLVAAPGSQQNPTTSCKDLLATSPNAQNGLYWLDLDGSGPQPAFQTYCNMTDHGGGWTLALGLSTTDSDVRHYNDTGFWTGTTPVGSGEAINLADYKSLAFANLPAKEIMIRAHSKGSTKGTAKYTLVATYQGKTIQWMFANLSNTTVTGPREANAGTVGANGAARNAGDAFIDHAEAVIFNSTYSPADASNLTRIGTNYAAYCGTISCDGHNFGGWGGIHARSGWGCLYEGASLNGYCSSQGAYGTNGLPNGSMNNAFNGCSPMSQAVDLHVYVR
jgi:hypothetical protein